jgi:hypothetical protein
MPAGMNLSIFNQLFCFLSLRDQLFLEADKLIGIYKIDQATGVVTYHDDEEDMIMAGEVD